MKEMATVAQRKYDEAKVKCQRALTILEKAFGPDHPQLSALVTTLANIFMSQVSC